MALFQIGNDKITIQVDSFGAELKSLKRTDKDMEYMWDGDPAYWKRTSPVLFPFVGGLQDGTYRYKGSDYPMSQHGFARDMECKLVSQTAHALWFELSSDEKTMEKYPFAFLLELGYELEDYTVHVKWRVKNPSADDMYFSIGAHPAFVCPINKEGRQSDYKIGFDTDGGLEISLLQNGLISGETKMYPLEKSCLQITGHLFDGDALVIEHDQAHKVTLIAPDGKPYVSVGFDAPLFGIWSPPGKNAPFICIEPWYGRCDRAGFTGTLEDREWEMRLKAGETFEASYTISI